MRRMRRTIFLFLSLVAIRTAPSSVVIMCGMVGILSIFEPVIGLALYLIWILRWNILAILAGDESDLIAMLKEVTLKRITLLKRLRKFRKKEIAASELYLRDIKYKFHRIKILIVVSAFSFYIAVKFYELEMVSHLIIAPVILYVLILSKEMILVYRINNEFFGLDAGEATQIVAFMISNSDNIDFTDDKGKPKAFYPEKSSLFGAQVLKNKEGKT